MTVLTALATWVELDVLRGVAYYEEFSLFQNIGTEAAPVLGDPLDLTDWPLALAMIDVAADQAIVRGSAAVVSANPARVSLAIPVAELDRAFDSGNRSRPLHVTLKAQNTAATRERVLLNGIIRVRESGY